MIRRRDKTAAGPPFALGTRCVLRTIFLFSRTRRRLCEPRNAMQGAAVAAVNQSLVRSHSDALIARVQRAAPLTSTATTNS